MKMFLKTSVMTTVAISVCLFLFRCSSELQPTIQDSESSVYDINSMNTGEKIPNEYIIVLIGNGIQSSEASVGAVATSLAEKVGIPSSAIHFLYTHSIKGFSATMTATQAGQIAKDHRVNFVEQDQVVSAIGGPVSEGDKIQAQTTPWGITRVGGPGVGIGKRAWIIDTGVDLDHPDLTVDVNRCRTFVVGGKDSKTSDDGHGHGSHVAGTVAAINNTNQVVGVAPGASVVGVKVLNSQGQGQNSWVIAGVNYVASNGVAGEVANMSLGGGISAALDAAVLAASANVKFSLAAGNSSILASNTSPARVNGPNIYTVSAIDNLDRFASFSNYGNPPVDFAAPGVSVLSLYKNGGTATMSGTSMAAPHVAGLLLLGPIVTSGYATGDRDATPDPIAHR